MKSRIAEKDIPLFSLPSKSDSIKDKMQQICSAINSQGEAV
jgi:hypothetical protein